MGDATVGQKLNAVSKRIREMANESGYGHFISDAVCQQWAANLVNTIDDVEQQAASGAISEEKTVTAAEPKLTIDTVTKSEGVDTTGG